MTQRLPQSLTISRSLVSISSSSRILESRGIGIYYNGDNITGRYGAMINNNSNWFSPISSSLNNHLRLTTSLLHSSVESSNQVRTMVMVTKTKSSNEDTTINNNGDVTTTANTDSSSDNTSIDNAGGGGIIVTTNCASRIRQLASSRPNPNSIYLRLYVDAGGCSGFQYKFLLLSEDDNGSNSTSSTDDGGEDGTIDPEEDVVFTKDGMRVVVDQTSLDLLRGSTIDYVSEMIRSSFAVVGNPQSESACGCGSSFAVKNFGSNPALD